MKNSKDVSRAAVFSLIQVGCRHRQLLVWLCLLAAFHLLDCPASRAFGGSYGGETGGDGLPVEADCRGCHEDLVRFPMLAATNVNKHHQLVGDPIVLTTAPPDVEPGEVYECLFCHPAVWDDEISVYRVSLFRDCLVCHPVETVSGPPRMQGSNRHHKLGYSCGVCHEQRR
ncbi:MAG: hypothetical protein C4531_13565 [Desulfurivibrio sp.]|nr:MAG: hypothetical protein C4531_13565 [Desulfurivibrio sp.]